MALYADTLLPGVREGVEKAGRSPDSIELMIEMKVSFDTDRRRALEDTRHWAALALSADEKVGIEDPVEMERRADALSAERAATRWIVSTDPEEHVARVAEYVALGFTHLVFHARPAHWRPRQSRRRRRPGAGRGRRVARVGPARGPRAPDRARGSHRPYSR
jgi:alkanesulfonate monooxygenase SsuD/methylene tetrahydromethanopterin reductase-like flavin-dependent oxidoreductase (luciferase family)